jgi:hypothetical protein
MAETKSKFLRDLIDKGNESVEAAKSFTSERQQTAQALALHVDYRDGRSNEGVGWSHFGRYQWRDLGNHESLRIIFGPMCAMEITGHNLGALVREIRDGQLNGIKEMVTGQAKLAVHEGHEEPVISGVTAYPDFDAVFESIKEEANQEHDTGFVGKVRGR